MARGRFLIRGWGCGLGAALLAAQLLSGCGSDTKKDAYVERSVEDLYNSAMDKLVDEDYSGASKDFDEVDRQHPYSVWATKAQLMDAYSLYQARKYDDAIAATDRFIQLHPGNRDVAYAYYLKALCYYVQITDVGRDQKITQQALSALDEVVRRFPDSKYARDARLKLDLTRDHLAGKEMEIGRWYERQGEYLAAINRFRRVIDNYQTTTHVPEALHRLTECYLALGVVDEARTTAAVLGHNYPGSEWYSDSYALLTGHPPPGINAQSWTERVFGGIF
jgi:outer membrane protein assembly factor BamD